MQLQDTNGAAHRRVYSSRIQVASTRWPTWAGGRCAGRAGPLAEFADALHIDVRDSIHVHLVATILLAHDWVQKHTVLNDRLVEEALSRHVRLEVFVEELNIIAALRLEALCL